MNIDPSTITHFFCIGPRNWIDEYRRTGRQEWLNGFINSTDLWKAQLGIEPRPSQIILGSYPENSDIDLKVLNVAFHDLGIWSAPDSTKPTDPSIYLQITMFKATRDGNRRIVIGLAYRCKELKIDQAEDGRLATYLPSDKAPVETPLADAFLYYSVSKFSQERFDAVRERFFERYHQLTIDALAGQVPGKFIEKFSADMYSGGYLQEQEVADFKRDLPKREPGGVLLDYFHKSAKGLGIDQFVVYWGPQSAKTILALVPEATRI